MEPEEDSNESGSEEEDDLQEMLEMINTLTPHMPKEEMEMWTCRPDTLETWPLRRSKQPVLLRNRANYRSQARERPTSQLCDFCRGALDQIACKQGEELHLKHYSSHSALQSSADNGCGLCYQFILGVERLEPEELYIAELENEGKMPKEGPLAVSLNKRYFWPDEYRMMTLTMPYSKGDKRPEPDEVDEMYTPNTKYVVNMVPALRQGMHCQV